MGGTTQKIGFWVIALAMVTTVSLPNRQFHRVVEAGGRVAERLLGTAMGTRIP